jgi:hypothetical protein
MKHGFTRGLIVGIVLVATVLSSWRIAQPAHAIEAGPSGRYHMLMSTLNARDVFLVDTSTDRIWQRTTITDLKGQPDIWHPMDRFDSLSQELQWMSSQPSQPTSSANR